MSRRLGCLALVVWLACAACLAEEPAAAPAAKKAADDVELLRLFADALDQVERNYVKPVNRRELLEGAIRGMLAKLDPHSTYIAPAEIDRFKTSVENEFGGIGVTVSAVGGQLLVVTPIYGTPAYKAGLRGGDTIVEIDGAPAAGIPVDEAVRRVKGPLGTAVKLTIQHAGGDTETVEVARAVVRVESVLGDRRKADDTWNFLLDEEKKIGYIRLINFGRHTADELRSALGELKQAGMQGLILDLRFNAGGLLTAAIEVSDLFLASGRIVSTSGRAGPQRKWDAHEPGTFEGFPMVVLVNRFSASASEIVAAALQDHRRAAIVGQRTWGKGSVQNVIELEQGHSALKLTTGGYLRPSGQNIHRFEGAKEGDDWGVKPDSGLDVVLTADEIDAYTAERRKRDAILAHPADASPPPAGQLDKQLQAALDQLLKQMEKDLAQSPVEQP
jgi:carboxyl-terminal processing protease